MDEARVVRVPELEEYNNLPPPVRVVRPVPPLATAMAVPFQVLGLIPLIGRIFSVGTMLVGIYCAYSQYRLIKEVHGLSTARAAAVVLIPIAVMLALIAMVIVGMLAVAGISANMPAAAPY